ncbi:MAG: hypothetical protein FJX62_03680 [Alphaproteobacteria bacterium]|nr:hypothetical protein [Alphaproteobacteria bacterium]
MPVLPPAVAWLVGTIGAAVLTVLAVREWRRVNSELDRARKVRVDDRERAAMPTLRRDPVTGEYRLRR